MWINSIDQTGFNMVLERVPEKIISVVPSQTELLFDLGLEAEVTGITKFCVHPGHWFRSKSRVGGTKNISIERVKALNPDLVIANKEENTLEDVEALRQICPVWTSDIHDIPGALDMIRGVGELVNRREQAEVLITEILNGMAGIKKHKKRVAYLIWKNPYMVAGGDTFIHSMLEACGWENAFGHLLRYPEVGISDLEAENIELLLLSSEPYPFKLNDIQSLHKILNQTNVRLVDGEIFSWYGSRMQHFPNYVREMQSG
jgi:ABC-type Fe3+-hydroxamate transport system substrate-binding protein